MNKSPSNVLFSFHSWVMTLVM